VPSLPGGGQGEFFVVGVRRGSSACHGLVGVFPQTLPTGPGGGVFSSTGMVVSGSWGLGGGVRSGGKQDTRAPRGDRPWEVLARGRGRVGWSPVGWGWSPVSPVAGGLAGEIAGASVSVTIIGDLGVWGGRRKETLSRTLWRSRVQESSGTEEENNRSRCGHVAQCAPLGQTPQESSSARDPRDRGGW
jgi:hypothetical protein